VCNHIPLQPDAGICVLTHNYELTNEYSLSSHGASLPNYRLQIARLQVPLQPCSIMASKCISELTRSQSQSASVSSLDHVLQVHLQTRSFSPFMCIFKHSRLGPPSSHDHGLPSTSLNSLDHGLGVHLQTRTIMASECISTFTRSRCGKTLGLEGRQRIIHNPRHLAWYPKGIDEKERF